MWAGWPRDPLLLRCADAVVLVGNTVLFLSLTVDQLVRRTAMKKGETQSDLGWTLEESVKYATSKRAC